VFGAAVNEVDKAIEEEERNDAPTAVTVVKAFTHDDLGDGFRLESCAPTASATSRSSAT